MRLSCLFAASWLIRSRADKWEPERAPAVVLGVLGAPLATVTGWLDGDLVERVGVDEGAYVDARNSLSGEAAAGM
jgi:hypothetical protein